MRVLVADDAPGLRRLIEIWLVEWGCDEREALTVAERVRARFRVNCYRAMGATGMVLRRVKTEVPNFEALELPPILGSLAMERQGLILVVGATGSGKSTTAWRTS